MQNLARMDFLSVNQKADREFYSQKKHVLSGENMFLDTKRSEKHSAIVPVQTQKPIFLLNFASILKLFNIYTFLA